MRVSVVVRAKGWAGKPGAFGLSIPADGWRPGMILVPVYAPLVSKTQLEEREALRRRLVVGGDFNEKVGATKDSLWRHVMGPYGDVRRTKGGRNFCSFAASQTISSRRQGRPAKFSSVPWLEPTDHEPVEMLFRRGKDGAGEAKGRLEVASSRPDVLLLGLLCRSRRTAGQVCQTGLPGSGAANSESH